MIISSTIFYFVGVISFFSASMLVLSRNPVYSILFLVLAFVNVSFILFFLELEYLPLIFTVVYVGALTVLFLFVMMMLNVRIADLGTKNLQILPALFLLVVLFFSHVFLIIHGEFLSLNNVFPEFCNEYSLITSDILFSVLCHEIDSNVRGLGFILYSSYLNLFILSGYVLLLSMVGVIVLTLRRYFTGRFQLPNSQIMQDFKKASKKLI
jgi:NADH-quinone oxidoreductase subunit J